METLTLFARQAAVAIENAQLYQQAQEQARKTAALAQIASRVALGGSLDAMLNEVARLMTDATGALACNLITMEGDPPRPLFKGAPGLPDGYMAAMEGAWRGGVRRLSAPERYYDPHSPLSSVTCGPP